MADAEHETRKRATRFLVAVLAILAFATFVLLRPIFSGLTFGLVVGFLLLKPYRRMSRGWRHPHLVAIGIVLVLCVAVDVPLFLLGWELVNEVRDFAAQLPTLGPQVEHLLVRLGVSPDAAAASVKQASDDALAALHASALPTLSFVGALLMNVGVFLFVLYYTLVTGHKFAAWVRDALPLPGEHADHLLDAVAARMRNLFLGTFLVATCIGVITGVVWWLLGFPNPVFWGAVLTVLNLIPALGMGVVVFPASAWAFLDGRVWQGAALLLWAMFLAGVAGNWIRAIFVGKTEGVHPILVLVGTIGGLATFGPAGFLLGPLILSMVDPVLAEWEALRRPEKPIPHAE
ncbi:MAG: hypothetical protein QOE90_504 [Thermoplasmata archaeon]|nr:hypothetical protein [Thermoplasmata archaeon]